jgi:hypothetical protein
MTAIDAPDSPTRRHKPSVRSAAPGPSRQFRHRVAGEKVTVDSLAGHLPGNVLDAVLADVEVQAFAVVRPRTPDSRSPRSHGSSAESPVARQSVPRSPPPRWPRCEPRPSQQPDGDNRPGRTRHLAFGPRPTAGRPGSPCPCRPPGMGGVLSVIGMPFLCVPTRPRARGRSQTKRRPVDAPSIT